MKKSTLTEDKVEQTPTGGVLVGKRKGQTIIHDKGTLSGYLVGKTHAEGGIKAVNKSTGQPLEMQGGEVVITAPAVSDQTKNEFNGKMMTNREILSQINVNGGGVAFAKGGDIPKEIKRTGASYKYGGKTMTDHEIYKKITGGHLAKGMTLPQIAKMHKVSVKELQKQVDMGMKAESKHTSSKSEQMKIVKDHLYENPKYYTLLKKAGLKRGGAVHKGSLVRDAKSGNTPARDLNNYNDVLDMDADGVVGAETGLFSGGGAVKKDSKIISYARGGATNVVVNNWSEIPDSYKNVTLPKRIDYNIKPSDDGLYSIVKPFLSTDPLRPAMTGINYDDNGITVTNAHILLSIPTQQDYFRGVYKPKEIATKIEGTYPKYEVVIIKERDVTKNYYVDVRKLLKYCKVAKNYSNKKKEITFKINGEDMSFLPDLIIDFLTSLMKLGGDFFNNVHFQAKNRALTFTKYVNYELGKDELALIMPYTYAKSPLYGTENPDKNAVLNVYYDFDDNEIHNADGSIVTDWEDKPKKERAKKTLKTIVEDSFKKREDSTGKFTAGEIGAFKQIDNIQKENNFASINVSEFTAGADTSFFIVNNDETGDAYSLRSFEKNLGVAFEDKEKEKSKNIIKKYWEWKASELIVSDETITDEDVRIKKEIQEFITKGGWDLKKEIKPEKKGSSSFWEFYKKTPPETIYTLNAITGEGLYPADEKTLKFLQKVGLLDVEKQKKETEKIEVFKLRETSEDDSALGIGIFSAVELLEYLKRKDISYPETIFSAFYIYDKDGNKHHKIAFGKGIQSVDELEIVVISKEYFDEYNWNNFFQHDLEDIKKDETQSGKFSDAEIDMFLQIEKIVKDNEIYEESVDEDFGFINTTSTKDWIVRNNETDEKFLLRQFGNALGYATEDTDTNVDNVKALIVDYKDWKKSLTQSGKFSDDDIDLFNQIDEIVKNNNIQQVTTIDWMWEERAIHFHIESKETGYNFYFRSVNDILGVQSEDETTEQEIALINRYLQWKESKPSDTPDVVVEKPKPVEAEKPKRNFDLERKYLTQRISDLAKELDLKRPILSNEEVAFYQREINSFILKLRKLNDAEMSLKSIEERVRGVYGLKISALESEYPETNMVSINGLKSQLTEKEYFNVRTPEFKSFFGDWETAYLNDSYAGVSKVINPITKEPQPVFHGTNVLFVNWQTYETNNAHYFAVKREFSEFFATTWEERSDKAGVDSQILKKLNPNKGSFLLRCFIDIKNPIDFSRFGVDKYPVREFLTFLRVNYNIGDFDFWTNITSHSGITQDTEVFAWQIIRLWQSFTKYVKVFTTYDGYIFYEYIPTKTYGGLENASLSFCAFESNQIKFADAYEFNALSNDSRFDLGGNI